MTTPKPDDPYRFIQLNTTILTDARVGRLSNCAYRLFMTSLIQVAQHRTDDGGFPHSAPTPDAVAWVAALREDDIDQPVRELQAAGLWENAGKTWSLPVVAEFITTAKPSSDARTAGQRGAHNRYCINERRPFDGCPFCASGLPPGVAESKPSSPLPTVQQRQRFELAPEDLAAVLDGYLGDAPDQGIEAYHQAWADFSDTPEVGSDVARAAIIDHATATIQQGSSDIDAQALGGLLTVLATAPTARADHADTRPATADVGHRTTEGANP